MATANELIRKTPLDVLGEAHIVESQIQDTSVLAGQIKQIAETNKQVSQLLNTLSRVPLKSLLTTIGTQGNASNILALSALRQTGTLDGVTDILDALSIIDSDNNKLVPYGRKTSNGIKALGGVLDSIVDLVPLSTGVKLALKGATGFLVSALVEFAPEIGDLIYEGFRAIEYELIELVIDKLFRDNNVSSVDSGKCCEGILTTLKAALLDSGNKPLLSNITQALRAGLLDFARVVDYNGETDTPNGLDAGKPHTLDHKPLIDKLLKGLSYQQRDRYGDAIIRDGSQGYYQPDATLALWRLYDILRTGLTQDKYDTNGLPLYDDNGQVTREGVLLPLLTKALLKPDTDADGNIITDAGGRVIYVSRFDFSSNSDVSGVLRECFRRPKLDDNGQAMTDADGTPLYSDSYLLDIVNELNQTTEVWTLDGVRLFLRDRLIEYT